MKYDSLRYVLYEVWPCFEVDACASNPSCEKTMGSDDHRSLDVSVSK
jgi:hypothetical protein